MAKAPRQTKMMIARSPEIPDEQTRAALIVSGLFSCIPVPHSQPTRLSSLEWAQEISVIIFVELSGSYPVKDSPWSHCPRCCGSKLCAFVLFLGRDSISTK